MMTGYEITGGVRSSGIFMGILFISRPLNSLRPIETLELESGLSLVPRIKLLLTVYRADKFVNPIDEWKFKRSLIDYIKSSFSNTVPDRLFVHDLGFLSKVIGETEDDVERADKKFLEWRRGFVEKLDGIELSLEGAKFKLNVAVPVSDDSIANSNYVVSSVIASQLLPFNLPKICLCEINE